MLIPFNLDPKKNPILDCKLIQPLQMRRRVPTHSCKPITQIQRCFISFYLSTVQTSAAWLNRSEFHAGHFIKWGARSQKVSNDVGSSSRETDKHGPIKNKRRGLTRVALCWHSRRSIDRSLARSPVVFHSPAKWKREEKKGDWPACTTRSAEAGRGKEAKWQMG